MLTATTQGNHIKIIDAKTGTTKRRIQYAGQLVQGPVVTGDECAITVRINPSLTYLIVYSMLSGALRRRVRV